MPVAAGASNLFLGRDTKVYLRKDGVIWEIPVLNGYSFNQSTNSSEVTVEEMSNLAGDSRRGKAVFNDSVSPTDWSFDVYARPYVTAGVHRSVDEPLWACLAAGDPDFTKGATADLDAWSQALDFDATQLDIDFNDSNKVSLGTFDLFFVFGANTYGSANYAADGSTTIYMIPNAVVNEANIPFDVNGITTVTWSGMGGTIQEETSFDASSAITAGTTQTNNFIRSRFTALSAVSSVSGSEVTYGITLTGGNISISNNINFLTPEELGRVNQPIAHVTGTRSVSGSFSCYLDETTNGPIDLYEDLVEATDAVRNSFALDFYIGGKDGANDRPVGPGMQFKIPNAHLEIPQMNPDDVISLEVNFSALPTTLATTDEIERISYVGV